MKRKKHSPEQIIAKLRKVEALTAEGTPQGQRGSLGAKGNSDIDSWNAVMIAKKYGVRQAGFHIGLLGGVIIYIVVIATTFNNVRGNVQPVGFIAIILTLGASNLLLLANLSLRNVSPLPFLRSLLLVSVLFVSTYFIGVIQRPSFASLAVFIQIALVLGFLAITSLCSWGRQSIVVIGLLSSAFIVLHMGWWALAGIPFEFDGYVANEQTFGPVVYLLLFFVLAGRIASRGFALWWYCAALGGVVLILASAARSAWIAVLAAATTYMLWNLITSKLTWYRIWISAVLLFVCIFTYVYAALAAHPKAGYWNAVARDYTGGNLFSGREDIWFQVIQLIEKRPWLGYGADALPRDYLYTTLSSHNLYLQTGLQVGVIGIGLFFILMWVILEAFWLARQDHMARLGAAFTTGIICHQMFDPALTQNNLSLGLLAWLVIGVAISKVIDRVNLEAADDHKLGLA